MRVSEPGFEPADQRFVGEQSVQVHRRFRNADPLCLGRNGRMQVCQRFAVIQPGNLGNEAFEQLQQSVGAVGEGR